MTDKLGMTCSSLFHLIKQEATKHLPFFQSVSVSSSKSLLHALIKAIYLLIMLED